VKRLALILVLGAATFAAAQTDHDNIDKGRPLSFEDAEPIATGGFAYELGLNVNFLRNRRVGFQIPLEFIWGGARNTQFEIGTMAAFGNRANSNRTGFDFDAYEVGVLHSLNRELPGTPAFALKFEMEAEKEGVFKAHYRVTGIATKTLGQYDRLHLNAGVEFVPSAAAGDNKTRVGAVLGFTKPLGYPRHFDTTGLAEISLKQGERRGDGAVTGVGLGVRRQISPRSVLDIGLQSELSGRNRVPLRFIVGYSTSM
jgi:hypothetical protein